MVSGAMDSPIVTTSLAQFCIGQRNAFDPADWHARFPIDRPAVALAAKYLSMTSWYGHDEELERIAAAADAFADSGANREARASDFDLAQFSYAVRIGVTQARARRAPRPPDCDFAVAPAKTVFA